MKKQDKLVSSQNSLEFVLDIDCLITDDALLRSILPSEYRSYAISKGIKPIEGDIVNHAQLAKKGDLLCGIPSEDCPESFRDWGRRSPEYLGDIASVLEVSQLRVLVEILSLKPGSNIKCKKLRARKPRKSKTEEDRKND